MYLFKFYYINVHFSKYGFYINLHMYIKRYATKAAKSMKPC